MSYKPIITSKSIIFHLQKPIYGSFYAIWDKWLKIAKERNLKIVVFTKEGTSTFSYETYMKGARKLERFYKNPNEPMVFWGKDFLPAAKERTERKRREKKEKQVLVNFFEIFQKLPEEKKIEIRRKIAS